MSAVHVHLSPREMDVLRELLKDGAANETIARRLGLSMETVKTHTRRLFLKTGCPTRAALVAAYFQGTIDVHDPNGFLVS